MAFLIAPAQYAPKRLNAATRKTASVFRRPLLCAGFAAFSAKFVSPSPFISDLRPIYFRVPHLVKVRLNQVGTESQAAIGLGAKKEAGLR